MGTHIIANGSTNSLAHSNGCTDEPCECRPLQNSTEACRLPFYVHTKLVSSTNDDRANSLESREVTSHHADTDEEMQGSPMCSKSVFESYRL